MSTTSTKTAGIDRRCVCKCGYVGKPNISESADSRGDREYSDDGVRLSGGGLYLDLNLKFFKLVLS